MLFRSVLTTAILAPVSGRHFTLLPTEEMVSSDSAVDRQRLAVGADGTIVGLGNEDGGKGEGQGRTKNTQGGNGLIKAKKSRAKRLCHPKIVRRVCSEAFEHGDDKHAQWDEIASAVSASKATVAKLRTTLGLEANPVECQKLCKALVKNLRSAGATVPERSDEACVCKEGQATCGVDVGERKIKGSVHNLKAKHNAGLTNDIATDDNWELKAQEQDITGMDIKSEEDCSDGSCIPYKQEELSASLARLFHIFPNFECGTETSLLQGPFGQEPFGWNSKIEDAKVQAQAWTDFTRGQLNANTAADERATWFGGSGTKSTSAVKTRIQESLNFISTKIARARYVYVPDNYQTSSRTACRGSSTSGVLAFVISSSIPRRALGDFRAASNPQCGRDVAQSQWLDRNCVLDASGNLIVYMCQKWANFPEDSRTSTLVHELIHHTGPSDVGGYISAELQAESQINQIETAENYAEFVQDVVDGGPTPTPAPTPTPTRRRARAPVRRRSRAPVRRRSSGTAVLSCTGSGVTDSWCNTNCNHKPPYCPSSYCSCQSR
jgi:hypothetical protein